MREKGILAAIVGLVAGGAAAVLSGACDDWNSTGQHSGIGPTRMSVDSGPLEGGGMALPDGGVGLCGHEGDMCLATACCGGLRCVMDSPNSGMCYRPCAANTDCGSGCCTDLKGTGDLECAPASACANPCTKQGATCTSSTHCCTGQCVTGTTNVDFNGCRPSCATNSDCLTGCCQHFSNAVNGFCVDAQYCACAPTGADCSSLGCCSGTCAATQLDGAPPFYCHVNCLGALDCDGGCCSNHLPAKTYGICLPKCS
jgi:hypothetical protein